MRSLNKNECQIIFRSKSGASISMAAIVTAPALPNLPLEALKLRIDTWLFNTLVSNGKKVDFKLSLDFEAPLALEKLDHFFQLFSWAKEGQSNLASSATGSHRLKGT